MKLAGSCQCGKVRFTVESDTPIPYQYCYCSICRKTAGGAFGCNIMGRRATLRVRGERFLERYHARVRRPGRRTAISRAERCFCARCGTHLFILDDEWPDGVWPNAGAIDTPLPEAPSNVHLMLRYKPGWVQVSGRGPRYAEYSELSIAEWHRRHARSTAKRRA
jgi:hypothetical protein